MKNLLKFFVVAILISPTSIFAQGATITGVEGIVQVRFSPTEEWKVAYTGMEVPEGSSIQTLERSRASVKFPNKSVLWLKENTSLAIKERQEKSSRMEIESGTVKFRVPHLKRKEKFELFSGRTVASVRGTEGIFKSFIEKDMQKGPVLHVLYGEVDVKLVTKEGKAFFDVTVPQGTGFTSPLIEGLEKTGLLTETIKTREKEGKEEEYKEFGAQAELSLLTPEEEKEGQEIWDPGLSPMERVAQIEAKEQAREMIKTFAEDVQVRNQDVKEQVVRIKEEDFATGRTLTDVHGNVVRVDQRLDRTNNSIQVINVVKRNGYKSGGLRYYAYSGSAGSRVDAIITKVVFNKDNLPDQVNEFPGFFEKEGDSIKIDKVQAVMANQTDSDNVFAIGFFGRRDAASGTDNIDSDLYIGTLQTTPGGTTGKQKLFSLDIDSSRNVSGLTRFIEDATVARISAEGVNGELYGREATRWQQQASGSSKLWLVTENFVINNSGNVKNVSDFTNASSNFEDLLKNSAGEMVIMAKTDVSNAPSATDANNFLGQNTTAKNIDIVIIPDLGLSIIKSLATSFDKFKTTY